jgi:hypothetical protein
MLSRNHRGPLANRVWCNTPLRLRLRLRRYVDMVTCNYVLQHEENLSFFLDVELLIRLGSLSAYNESFIFLNS